MKNQAGYRTRVVLGERDLGLDHLEEELGLRFREHGQLSLACRLHEQGAFFEGYDDGEGRRELIPADLARQDLFGHLDLGPFRRSRCER